VRGRAGANRRSEDTVISREGSSEIDLRYRQIVACAMRDYPNMLRETVKEDLSNSRRQRRIRRYCAGSPI
jgi:hypothetical protein